MRFMAPRASTLDLVFLMNMSCLTTIPFPGFGVPVPRGRSAALGEVSRRGAVSGLHHLSVDIPL